jgi:glycerate dehydrogenase
MKKAQKPNIVFLDAGTVDLDDLDLSPLKKVGSLRTYEGSPQESIVERSAGAQIIITNKCILNDSVLKKLPDLKLICVAATGVNNVDLDEAKKLEIAVANVGGYSTQTVVEHTFMFLLAFSHRLFDHHQAVLQKVWSSSPYFALFDYPYSDLEGKTLGVIGYGEIGKKVAHFAKAFGMKVLIAKIPGRKYPASPKRNSIEEILKVSDYVTLHCPLTKETHHLINTKRLNVMRRSAYLLNMARGSIVNEWAVAEALQSGRLAGYAADVMEQEPPPADHPFFQEGVKNKVLLTPHIAWASRESRQRLIEELAENIAAFKKGKMRDRVV